MVRAILAGRKTQTRRVVKWPLKDMNFGCELAPNELSDDDIEALCPYGMPKAHLWVKETFQWAHIMNVCHRSDTYPIFRATDLDWETTEGWAWKPSIFMPRQASRITLEICNVRVQRLQNMTDQDACAEGCCGVASARFGTPSFKYVWALINGKTHPWESNPWVWVIEFKNISNDKDQRPGPL